MQWNRRKHTKSFFENLVQIWQFACYHFSQFLRVFLKGIFFKSKRTFLVVMKTVFELVYFVFFYSVSKIVIYYYVPTYIELYSCSSYIHISYSDILISASHYITTTKTCFSKDFWFQKRKKNTFYIKIENIFRHTLHNLILPLGLDRILDQFLQ